MIGIARGHDRHPGLFGLLDRRLHSEDSDELAHSVVSLDHGRDGCLKYDLRFCVYFDDIVPDPFVIADEALHSVGLDPVFIRQQQNIRDDLRLFFGKSKSLKRFLAKYFQYIKFQINMRHKHSFLEQLLIFYHRIAVKESNTLFWPLPAGRNILIKKTKNRLKTVLPSPNKFGTIQLY